MSLDPCHAGTSERDHCNARKSTSWDRLRNLARSGRMAEVRAAHTSAAAAAPPPRNPFAFPRVGGPPGAPVALPTRAPPPALGAAAARQPGIQAPPAPDHTALMALWATKPMKVKSRKPAPAVPGRTVPAAKAPAGLTALPDPAKEPNAIELGRLTLTVKVGMSPITSPGRAAQRKALDEVVAGGESH